jgi:hypothetical protein
VNSVIAISASSARTVDGCIPTVNSTDIVWVTKGTGDYLNLSDHPWSTRSSGAAPQSVVGECSLPGPAGTIVIDDATGNILGVFPEQPGLPRPTPFRP